MHETARGFVREALTCHLTELALGGDLVARHGCYLGCALFLIADSQGGYRALTRDVGWLGAGWGGGGGDPQTTSLCHPRR
jgi:hypothetical protein